MITIQSKCTQLMEFKENYNQKKKLLYRITFQTLNAFFEYSFLLFFEFLFFRISHLYFLGEKENSWKFYLEVYAIIVGCNCLITLVRSFLFAYGGLNAAESMHRQLLNKILGVSSLCLFIYCYLFFL